MFPIRKIWLDLTATPEPSGRQRGLGPALRGNGAGAYDHTGTGGYGLSGANAGASYPIVNLMLEGVRTDRHGEYRQDEVRNTKVTDAVIADAVEVLTSDTHMGKKSYLLTAIHRDHSKRVCEGLRAVGAFTPQHVDGDDPSARRDRIMNEFKTGGTIRFLGNCDLISEEGFDAPTCETVMLGAPTTSSNTGYLAACPVAPCVQHQARTALILDLAGISHDLGLPNDVREWSLEDGEVRDGKKAHKTPNDCPRCQTVFWGRICPSCQPLKTRWRKCRRWTRSWRKPPARPPSR